MPILVVCACFNSLTVLDHDEKLSQEQESGILFSSLSVPGDLISQVPFTGMTHYLRNTGLEGTFIFKATTQCQTPSVTTQRVLG